MKTIPHQWTGDSKTLSDAWLGSLCGSSLLQSDDVQTSWCRPSFHKRLGYLKLPPKPSKTLPNLKPLAHWLSGLVSLESAIVLVGPDIFLRRTRVVSCLNVFSSTWILTGRLKCAGRTHGFFAQGPQILRVVAGFGGFFLSY